MRTEVIQLISAMTPQIEEWMRMNAPWDDRTLEERLKDTRLEFPFAENARWSLFANLRVGGKNRQLWIELGYKDHVYYSVYLEYAMGSAFEILAPTMDYWFPIIGQRLSEKLSAMQQQFYQRRVSGK
jgi:hypothetical protein